MKNDAGALWMWRSAMLLLLVCGIVVAPLRHVSAADLSIAREFFPPTAPVTIEQAAGTPPAAAMRDGDGRLLAYAFSTREVSGSVGYAGRPIDIVAAVTPQGVITGARIVAHEEPILVIGIPREAIAAYVANFRGFDVTASAALRKADASAAQGPQAVAGATVTSTVIRDAVLRSARAVLQGRAATRPGTVRLDRTILRRLSWPALLEEKAVRRLSVTRGEAARLLGRRDEEPDKPFIELWLALATPPAIGESLLGQRIYESELAKLAPDDDLIVIGASGLYSFKGTEWRRSGVFERIQLVQGANTIALRAADHVPIEALRAAGAPELREIAVFRIARERGFDNTLPFRLDIALAPAGLAGAGSATVSLDYRVPDHYLVRAQPPSPERAEGAPAQDAARAPLWQEIWYSRRGEIAGLALMLCGLGGILIFQNWVTRRGSFYYRLRVAYLIVTFVFLGLIANAQLSVVNVLTFVHALLSGFRWELFLLDPLVFILWSFVAVSMLFWGRGVFCGWLCPFGALQELVNMLAQRLGVKQVEIPFGLHERLWMLKYVIFLGILAVSLHSIMAAFGFAEIEPFKTAITMKFLRDWPFVSYAGLLLMAGFFVERFYCRYLCPLGAALAIPARMRMFEWLKRYRECGAECHICARRCTVQAIHPLGQINPNECVYCLKCQANYFDGSVCLHLKKRAERRAARGPAPARPAQGEGHA
jgi:transcriptional regulator of nitric oxide reductase